MPISKLFSFLTKKTKIEHPNTQKAVILSRSEHNISRQNISPNALKVLYRLHNAGYQAYLVGGCVRDMLLGREPKDFDIATDAKPAEVNSLFKNARLIGRRFRLVHILFRQEIIEVSTFRACTSAEFDSKTSKEGMLLRDNVYGTIEEDAERRDFTINALYYNIADFSVVDFHDGLKDLKQGLLKIIGVPEQRYREDPVRMLRAVRLAAKLGFRMSIDTETPINHLRFLLGNIAPARLFTETLKLFLGGQAHATFIQLRHYRLFEFLFPATEKILQQESFATISDFISFLLTDTDARIADGKTVSPGYLAAGLLWHAFIHEYNLLHETLPEKSVCFSIAYNNITSKQQKVNAIPKHFFLTARTIWELQFRMEQLRPSRCYSIVNHQRFRAAMDFLKLRQRARKKLHKCSEWWQNFYIATDDQRTEMLVQLKRNKSKAKSIRNDK